MQPSCLRVGSEHRHTVSTVSSPEHGCPSPSACHLLPVGWVLLSESQDTSFSVMLFQTFKCSCTMTPLFPPTKPPATMKSLDRLRVPRVSITSVSSLSSLAATVGKVPMRCCTASTAVTHAECGPGAATMWMPSACKEWEKTVWHLWIGGKILMEWMWKK